MKVLIVDDSKAMRMIIKRMLRQAGFEDVEADEAVNGTRPHRRTWCCWIGTCRK